MKSFDIVPIRTPPVNDKNPSQQRIYPYLQCFILQQSQGELNSLFYRYRGIHFGQSAHPDQTIRTVWLPCCV